MNYRQKIKVTKHATAIMKLPCIYSCHKDGNDSYVYLLYDWDSDGHYIEAHEGDWLCEDESGRWKVLTKKQN